MKKRLAAIVLSMALTAASLTACGEDNKQEKDKAETTTTTTTKLSTEHEVIAPAAPEEKPNENGYWHTESTTTTTTTTSKTTTTTTTAKEENNGASELPKGADSAYELYKTIVDFHNNGGNTDDLKDVYDVPLNIVMRVKEEDDKWNFTLGMNWEKSRELVAKLVKIADDTRSEMPRRDNGTPDAENIDYSPYKKAFPESMQQKINDNEKNFMEFIYGYIIDVTEEKDKGLNYIRAVVDNNIKVEVLPEDKLETQKYKRQEKYNDLRDNFPQIYEAEHTDDNRTYNRTYRTYLEYYYTEINGKFYLYAFQNLEKVELNVAG